MRKSRVFGSGETFANLESDVEAVLSGAKNFTNDTRYMREELKELFIESGWVPDFRIGESNLRIGYKRGDSGLCIQLGNVARFHSDLLKIALLGKSKTITHGVIVVPTDDFSKYLGSNHASYSKCERDIELFMDVIAIPILLMEIEGET
jgi:hypothetical protein